MESQFNISNLEVINKTSFFFFFLLLISFSLPKTFSLQINTQWFLFSVSKSSSDNESMSTHIAQEWEDVRILQEMLSVKLGSGQLEFPTELLGMAFPSHHGSSGAMENECRLLLSTTCKGWRLVTNLQIFFCNIFQIKLVSHPAVMNSSFSEQVISVSEELRKKSSPHPYSPPKKKKVLTLGAHHQPV